MKEEFLLHDGNAVALYESTAALPIIDFHNHISIIDIAKNRKFDNVYELWLECDPYKHRLMRICGIEEHFITGGASPYEKFLKFCSVFPYLAGTPVFDWSRMELSRIFGINELPTKENAKYIYDECGEMLMSEEFSNNSILKSFGIEYQAPIASLLDDISLFNGKDVAPSLRADELVAPTKPFLAKLEQKSRVKIADTASYIRAVSVMLDTFGDRGCRFADHALDAEFFEEDTDGNAARMLKLLGGEYARRGWTLLLHLDAKRKTSKRLSDKVGAAGGYAAVGGRFDIRALCELLNVMEENEGFPDTVLFPLNMNDQATLAVLQGSFSEDKVPSKVQLGPAWWWCDHTLGIENALNCISSFGVVSQFIGMTTDSRSILSFVRHDYFRRILCSWFARKNERDGWDLPFDTQIDIIRKICYENAKKKIERRVDFDD